MGAAVLALVVGAAGMLAAASALRSMNGTPGPAAPSIIPANVRDLRIAWTAHVGGNAATYRPAVAGGMVFVSSDKLYAFDGACGSSGGRCSPLWVAVPESGRRFTQPVAADGMVFTSSGSLYAFPARCDTKGGVCQPEWVAKAPPGDAAGYSSPTVRGGVAYVNDADGPYGFQVNCASNGSECAPVWHGEGSGGYLPPAIGDDMLFVNGRGTLYAYPTECGAQRLACKPAWTAPVGDPLTSPVVADGMVFVRHHALKAFSAGCGGGGATCQPDWIWEAPFGTGISELAVAQGVVYVAADRLYTLAASCGTKGTTCEPLWSSPIEGTTAFESPLPAPFAADGLVFAAGNRLYAFPTSCGTQDCQPIWTSTPRAGGGNFSSLVASSNAVYVMSPEGEVQAWTVGGRAP